MRASLNPEILYGVEAYPAESKLEEILYHWTGKRDYGPLRGSHVLDLASGSVDSPGNWPPYFSRISARHGANVVALDLHPQSKEDSELFSWASVDLIEAVCNQTLSSLEILERESFDIINSANFVGFNSPPGLNRQLQRFGLHQDEFEIILLDQLTHLLKEGGIISLDQRNKRFLHIMHVKTDGKLVSISR